MCVNNLIIMILNENGLENLINIKIFFLVLLLCSFCLKIYVWYLGLVVKEGWLGFYVYVDILKYRWYNI